ncbi:MAG: hypothetical protein C0504_20215 [Candidatus Solibacter sp.]|nr:hypothetical protein [Candidatus Solibacter sp.]
MYACLSAVLLCAAATGRTADCLLACTPAQAAEARRIAPSIRFRNMAGRRTGNLACAAKADFIQLRGGLDTVAESVDLLHPARVKVNCFSAQDDQRIARLDSILTGDLDLPLSILARRGVQPGVEPCKPANRRQ